MHLTVVVAGVPAEVLAPLLRPLDGGSPDVEYRLDGYVTLPLALALRPGAVGATWDPSAKAVIATHTRATVAAAGDVDWAGMDAAAREQAYQDYDELNALLDDLVAAGDDAARARAAHLLGLPEQQASQDRQTYAARRGIWCPIAFVDADGWRQAPDTEDVRDVPEWVEAFRTWREQLPADVPVRVFDAHC